MTNRARAASPRRAPNPLAATLAPVAAELPAAPSDPTPTPTFLPNPTAAWRALRAHWIAQRGERPARTLPNATFPATTVADVVEIANHVTAALRNDVARVDPALGRRIWDRWRQSVAVVRKRVSRARDNAAVYQDNETFWEDAILFIVWTMPGQPRNALGAAVVVADGDGDPPRASPPTISSVEILWSENREVPTRTFPSLWEADAALARAFASDPPPDGGGYDKTSFRIVWSDDMAHEGRIDVNPEIVATAALRGGMLRGHVEDFARYLTSERQADFWKRQHGDGDPDGLADRQAWGRELRARLDADRRTHTDASAVRNVGKPLVSQRPTILAVDITWSSDDALPTGRFPSLAAADAALTAYFTSTPPKLAHYRITYRVTFTDGAAHQGRVELPAAAIDDWIQQGGVLRHHLMTEGVKQRKEGGNSWSGLHSDAAIDTIALGGIELRRRIVADTKALAAASPRSRVAKRASAEASVPELRAPEQAARWIARMPSPPRLAPSPQDRFLELYRALQGAFDGGRVDWASPHVNAFVNYITRALRTELPLLNAGDAAIIGWRWREAVQGFQRHRTDENHGDIYFRALTIARQVEYSQRDPGSVYLAFCPWRSLYFDRPASPPRAGTEVDPGA